MSEIIELTSGDLSTLWRAAKRLDREADTWEDGWCITKDGERVWPDPPQDELQAEMEVRTMGLRTSARMLREMAKKLSRKAELPFDTSDEL